MTEKTDVTIIMSLPTKATAADHCKTCHFFLIFAASVIAAPAVAEQESVLSASLNYRSNIPNALDESNIFGDTAFDLHFAHSRFFVTSPGNRLSVSASTGARQYRHTQGLEHVHAGAALGYSHRLGLGAYAPRFNASLAVSRYEFNESIRDAWLSSLDMSLSQRLNPDWLLTAGLLLESRDAKSRARYQFRPDFEPGVFDQKSATLSARLDYTLPGYSLLSLSYQFRDGDIDASARPGSPLLLAAKAIARDTGLGRNYVAYLLEAKSHSAGITWTTALDDNSSLGLGYLYSRADAGQGIEYDHNNVRAEYTWRF